MINNKMNTMRSGEMKNIERQIYEEPSSQVIEVRYEGVICGSLGNRGNYDPTNENPFG